MRLAAALCIATLLGGCAAAPARDGMRLRFIGEQRIAHRLPFEGTEVGGLSGIDYDPRSRTWILASDDRSEHGPARWYTARLDLDATAFRAVTLDLVHAFRQRDGSTYPAACAANGDVADIEAVRFDPVDATIWYASEGSGPCSTDPFVRQASADGAWRRTLALPEMFRTRVDRSAGPRSNLSFEGLAFDPDGRSLWLAMEAPLFQDGPLAEHGRGAVTRLSHLARTGALLAQFAYPLDPVPRPRKPGRFSDNGVAEVLVAGNERLLVLERAGVQDAEGRFDFYIRLYSVDLDGASDIAALPALAGSAYRPLHKQLLLDLNAAGLAHVDNLEGMAWGPVLANGHRTLVLVADDNFSADQVTQLLAFEVQ